MRPREKVEAKSMNLTLSLQAREWLEAEKDKRQLSRSNIVEELIRQEESARVQEEVDFQKKSEATSATPARYGKPKVKKKSSRGVFSQASRAGG